MLPFLLLLIPLIPSAMAADVASTCASLLSQFPQGVSGPSQSPYSTTQSQYWNLGCALSPACIFYPASAQEVSKALELLVSTKTPFAVKSGGHSSNPGAADIHNGVTISTERLKSLEWSHEDKVLQVGAGSLWGEVYAMAEEKGKTVVGGRIPNIGVSGLTLGGGLAFNGGKYGFTADNVVGYEVVLASGKIVYATQFNIYADLYRALKGGGNNFGIVTRFDYAAYDDGKTWGANLMTILGAFGGPSKEAALDAVIGYNVEGCKNPDTGMVMSFTSVPAMGATIFLANLYARQRLDPNVTPPEFQKFLDLSVSDPGYLQQGPMEISQLAAALGQGVEKGKGRNTIHFASVVATPESITKIYDEFFSTFGEISSTPGLRFGISLQPIPDSFITAGYKNGGNPIGVKRHPHRQPYVWVGQSVGWDNAADDKLILSTQRKAKDAYFNWAKERGLADDFVFMNEADSAQDVFGSYGLANKKFLKRVKVKYDTHDVFGKLAPGGFKL